MTAFIEEHRGQFGVEPMCRMLQIAQSTYYERRAIARDPDRASRRAKSDADLCIKIDAAWKDNRKLYGARKIWHVLLRDSQDVARCTVERLMRRLGLKGVVRGKKVVTTNPDTSQPCPDDKVNRVFKADRPNQLWVSDFTYVPRLCLESGGNSLAPSSERVDLRLIRRRGQVSWARSLCRGFAIRRPCAW